MPGIINNHFRKYNAGNFIEAFGETNPDVIYLFIGKNDDVDCINTSSMYVSMALSI